MHHKSFLWLGSIVGGAISIATLAQFFQTWNPILQGGVYISTLVIMWWSVTHKKKLDSKDTNDVV